MGGQHQEHGATRQVSGVEAAEHTTPPAREKASQFPDCLQALGTPRPVAGSPTGPAEAGVEQNSGITKTRAAMARARTREGYRHTFMPARRCSPEADSRGNLSDGGRHDSVA